MKKMTGKPPSSGKRQAGFTLIEIMLALLVVTVGILAMTGLLGTSLDTSVKAHEDLDAVSFADMVFNYYHSSTNWSEIPPDGSWTVPDYNGGDVNLASGQFTCLALPRFGNTEEKTYTVSYILHAAQPEPGIKALTLQVWPGYATNGTPRTFYTELYRWVKP